MIKSGIFIGSIIKDILMKRGMTKAQLSRILGVKPQSVDYLLTRKSVDTDTLYAVSVALDYDFAALFLLKGEQENSDNQMSQKKVKTKLTFEVELTSEEISKLNLQEKGLSFIDAITKSE